MTLMAVDVNEELLKKFRSFAVKKHGRIYGVLKPEVELALRNHLTDQEGAEASEVDSA